MARTLVVPGVSISTQFEVTPPLPARSGVLGAVGVVDDSAIGVVGVTSRQELLELFGSATRFSFPEAVLALTNGISEVVVSPVAGGTRAAVNLADDDDADVVRLVCRAAGPWGNRLRARVRPRLAGDGTVRNVTLELILDGRVVETHDGLILSAGHDSDLFTVINRSSQLVVAVDAAFGLELPSLDPDRVAFTDEVAASATGTLDRGGSALIDLTARSQGTQGNVISVSVRDGRVGLTLVDAAAVGVARIRRSSPAEVGDPAFAVIIADNPGGGIDVTITTDGSPTLTRTVVDMDGLEAELTAAGFLFDRLGDTLPAPTGAAVVLAPTRTVSVLFEGLRTDDYEDLVDAAAIVSALAASPDVQAALSAGADGNLLPDVTPPPVPSSPDDSARNSYLVGGRDPGLARRYAGQTRPDAVLELTPAEGSDGASTRFRVMAGSAPNTVRIEAGVITGSGFELREAYDELTMDPDDSNYLPAVLDESSQLLAAIDRYPRTGVSTFPADTRGTVAFGGGAAPSVDQYQSAIDALALEDSVDLMLAGLQGWADGNLDGVAVQQAMLGHARAQADAAKPRIVLASVPPAISGDTTAIVDHAELMRDKRLVLVAPGGAEGAVAGLLGHINYFQSATFKTVASPGVELVAYRESELIDLVGPNGNVSVIAARRGRGVILVRALSTDGSQISVTRVADRSVREVKAISDRFIGELNNADTRNALKQMIVARFTQMERDGAIVPSVDGTSPAFQVEVYASQVDAASGIVRIDLAVRPVREIAFVYANLTIQI